MNFKKETALIVAALFVSMFLCSCGNNKTIGGETYQTYGLLNKDDCKNPDIRYKIIPGNIVWSIILCETIIAPIYFFGFSLYEPVCLNSKDHKKGTVNY